jgi:2-keto-3-deoxy-L-rhamnonate aldolase RhmA
MANSLVERLKTKPTLMGMQCFTGSAALVEIIGYSGFDWVSIDMEHSTVNFSDVENLVRAAQVAGTLPLVRVMDNQPDLIMKALDAGAAGVIVPHVQKAADLKRALASARYYPDGERGKCGQVRSFHYGADGVAWKDHWKKANQDVIVMPLVEEKEGMENLDEILAVDGVDVFWIGIGDLAQSYGVPGANMANEPLKSVALEAIAKAKKAGKVLLGCSSPVHTIEYCQTLINMGFKGISFGTDTSIFRNACWDAMKLVR